jgi:secreted PhoX family phosphatase
MLSSSPISSPPSSAHNSDAEDFTVEVPLSAKEKSDLNIKDAIFKNMRLRRIIKENHNSFINQIAFFHNPSSYHHLHQQDSDPTADNVNLFSENPAAFKDIKKQIRTDEDDTSNVLATVGQAQVTKLQPLFFMMQELRDQKANVYDNQHLGDHLDIMSHFSVDGQGYEATPNNQSLTVNEVMKIHSPIF